jgi:hypothetical protein
MPREPGVRAANTSSRSRGPTPTFEHREFAMTVPFQDGRELRYAAKFREE